MTISTTGSQSSSTESQTSSTESQTSSTEAGPSSTNSPISSTNQSTPQPTSTDQSTTTTWIYYSGTTSNECPNPEWAIDDNCDDDLNTPICNFDGGACCLPSIHDQFCILCICYEDGTRHPSAIMNGPTSAIQSTTAQSTPAMPPCMYSLTHMFVTQTHLL